MSKNASPIVIKASAKVIIGWLALSSLLFVAVVIYMVSRDFEPAGLWALLLVPIAIDIWAAARLIRLNARKLVVGDGVLRLEDGLVSKKECNVMMDTVRDVEVTQSVWQRILNVGNVRVVSIGDSGHIEMEDVDGPRAAAEQILTAIGKRRR
jgi:uncharacterized membrane protein YdbT with pleckstrin-like domain